MKSPTRFAALVAFLASFLLSSAVAHAQGWVPTPRGGGGGGGGGGGITCPTGDLGTGCYVQSLSGNNNAGGAIPLSSGAYITAASVSNSYIDLTGANASYGYAKFLNYVQTPEVIAPGTLSIGLNGTAGELTLDTTTNAGYTTIKTPTGTNLYFEAQLGAGIEYHVADAGIYFVSTGIYLDGVLQIQNPGNGNPVWTWSANDTALATQTAAASTAGLQIGQATQNSATVPANFVVKPQWQSGTDEGSAAANTPASFVVNYGAPYTASNAGSEAGFIVERNGVFFGSIQGWTGAPTAYGTLYLGPGITPAGTNYTILSDGTSNTYFNSPGSSGQIHFQIANTDYYEMAKTYFAPATDNAYANGTNGARWQYISTGPTGFLVYHAQGDATAIARMYDNGGVPSLLFGAAGSSPLISQSTQTSDIAPNDLTIQSQGPFASASTHKSPGNLVFNTPAPVSGGNTGYSYFETGGTKIAAFGTYNNGTSTGTLYLGSPAAAPSLSNWSIYNNGSGATVFNATSVIYFDIASTGYLQLAL
ncbi:MAG TPA: hypothetical protein VJ818_00235, partial [Actinomycetota bacterium]|nr:hypothetical protein [Actinomycetota bacterium]